MFNQVFWGCRNVYHEIEKRGETFGFCGQTRAHHCGFLAVSLKTNITKKKKTWCHRKKIITETNKVALASDAVNPILCGEFRFE